MTPGNPLKVEAGREAPTPPAMTLVVGARFTRALSQRLRTKARKTPYLLQCVNLTQETNPLSSHVSHNFVCVDLRLKHTAAQAHVGSVCCVALSCDGKAT